jgi:hypothetical protein
MLVKTLVPVHGPPVPATRFVLWDGPSGSGKSLAIHEVLQHFSTPMDAWKMPPQVVQEIQLVTPLTEDRLLQGLWVEKDRAETQVITGWDISTGQPVRWTGQTEAGGWLRRPALSAQAVAQTELGPLLRLRVARLDVTRPELLLAPAAALGPHELPQSLLHVLAYAEGQPMEAFNDALQRICGVRVCWDDSEVTHWRLRVGTPPMATSARERLHAFRRLDCLEEQPRSVQVVACVVLCCLLLPGRLLLWDQAAEGVDPSIAERLGMWLARNSELRQQQWFLAGAEEPFVRGLADGGAEFTRIRLRRRNGKIHVTHTPAASVRAVYSCPWIRLQHAEAASVSQAVILTENEVERALFRLLADLFAPEPYRWYVLHTYGPHFAPHVYQSIRACGVPIAVVSPPDVLGSKERFAQWCQLVTGEEPRHEWLVLRDRIAEAVEGALDPDQLARNRRQVESFLDALQAGQPHMAPGWENELRSRLEKWRAVRSKGLAAVPAVAHSWSETLIDALKHQGWFLCPVGTIRNWFDSEPARADKPWFERAVERLRQGDCPAPLQAFFMEMVTWLSMRSDLADT